MEIFNNKKFIYNDQVTNSEPDLLIFDYVQKNGISKEANVFLLKSLIDFKSGEKSFSSGNKDLIAKLKGYFDLIGISYKETSKIETLTVGVSPTTGIPSTVKYNTYSIEIEK